MSGFAEAVNSGTKRVIETVGLRQIAARIEGFQPLIVSVAVDGAIKPRLFVPATGVDIKTLSVLTGVPVKAWWRHGFYFCCEAPKDVD